MNCWYVKSSNIPVHCFYKNMPTQPQQDQPQQESFKLKRLHSILEWVGLTYKVFLFPACRICVFSWDCCCGGSGTCCCDGCCCGCTGGDGVGGFCCRCKPLSGPMSAKLPDCCLWPSPWPTGGGDSPPAEFVKGVVPMGPECIALLGIPESRNGADETASVALVASLEAWGVAPVVPIWDDLASLLGAWGVAVVPVWDELVSLACRLFGRSEFTWRFSWITLWEVGWVWFANFEWGCGCCWFDEAMTDCRTEFDGAWVWLLLSDWETIGWGCFDEGAVWARFIFWLEEPPNCFDCETLFNVDPEYELWPCIESADWPFRREGSTGRFWCIVKLFPFPPPFKSLACCWFCDCCRCWGWCLPPACWNCCCCCGWRCRCFPIWLGNPLALPPLWRFRLSPCGGIWCFCGGCCGIDDAVSDTGGEEDWVLFCGDETGSWDGGCTCGIKELGAAYCCCGCSKRCCCNCLSLAKRIACWFGVLVAGWLGPWRWGWWELVSAWECCGDIGCCWWWCSGYVWTGCGWAVWLEKEELNPKGDTPWLLPCETCICISGIIICLWCSRFWPGCRTKRKAVIKESRNGNERTRALALISNSMCIYFEVAHLIVTWVTWYCSFFTYENLDH